MKRFTATFLVLFLAAVNVSAVVPDARSIAIGGGGRITRLEKYKKMVREGGAGTMEQGIAKPEVNQFRK